MIRRRSTAEECLPGSCPATLLLHKSALLKVRLLRAKWLKRLPGEWPVFLRWLLTCCTLFEISWLNHILQDEAVSLPTQRSRNLWHSTSNSSEILPQLYLKRKFTQYNDKKMHLQEHSGKLGNEYYVICNSTFSVCLPIYLGYDDDDAPTLLQINNLNNLV